MKAYAYDPETKEYIGEVNCQPNPLEGGFLLPGNATLKKPPVIKEGQIIIWEEDEWLELLPTIIYTYNLETGEYIEKAEYVFSPLEEGQLPPDGETLEEPPSVEEKQVAIWNNKWEIKDDCRGEKYWDKTTKEEIMITEIGIVKDDNWTELEPISERCVWEKDKWIEPPLTIEELQEKEKADYIQAMPDLVKTLVIEIENLKIKVTDLEKK